jgi:hypothetical protein
MSVSLYRSQVDRLAKELAGLERRYADEKGRATKEHGEALRVHNSLSPTTTASMVQSKLREIQRREDNAVRHEKQAAQIADQMANKRRSMSSASSQLEQALKRQRDTEDRDRRRQHEEDLRRLRELEQARGNAFGMVTASLSGGLTAVPASDMRSGRPFEYDVCLSFAGEERSYVEMVARELQDRGIKVFYDADEVVTLWGKDLVEHFDHVYREASRYCVMFVSAAYAAKSWTRHERRSALARALQEEGEYILPARFDDTELPGIPPTVGYIDLSGLAPATLAQFVAEKVELGSTSDVSEDDTEA